MRALLLLLLLAGMALLEGCVGPESENASVRPWNTSKGWDSGLPPGMTEGR